MTQKQIFNLIDKYVGDQQDKLLRNIGEYERRLLKMVIDKFVSQLVIDNGQIQRSGQNINLTTAIDEIFREYKASVERKFLDDFAQSLNTITFMNGQYFSMFDTVSRDSFKKIQGYVEAFMRQTLGITAGGSINKNGFLDNFKMNENLKVLIKENAINAIKGGMGLGDYTAGLKIMLEGDKNVESKVSKHYKGFAYDTYQQYDRAVGRVYADKLGMKYFIYAGGLIETSRVFCIMRNGQVFSTAEADEWKNDPDLPKDPGGQVINYVPTINMGRWNCRHRPRWISEELAFRLRPDLADSTATGPAPVIPDEVKKMMEESKQVGPSFHSSTTKLAEKYNSGITKLSYKSASSIMRKAKNDYEGDYTQVKDAVRNTIIADPKKINDVIEGLKKMPEFVRAKAQSSETDPLGYSGFIVNLKLSNGILAETQVNTAEMIYAKQDESYKVIGLTKFYEIKARTGLEDGLGHKFYEEWRLLNPKIPAEAAKMLEIEKKSKEYYSKFQ